MEILTERLKLIPCTLKLISDHADQGYSFGNDVLESVQYLNSDPSQFGWGVWFVFEQQSGKLIGDMGFKGKPDGEQTVDIGYGISSDHQNKGYATEGAKALIDWAFSTDKVKKVKADCLHNNEPSIKVLQKLGMTRVGKKGDFILWELV
jgi:[ribosomal protein S5]-alanine N-acetyltransferase